MTSNRRMQRIAALIILYVLIALLSYDKLSKLILAPLFQEGDGRNIMGMGASRIRKNVNTLQANDKQVGLPSRGSSDAIVVQRAKEKSTRPPSKQQSPACFPHFQSSVASNSTWTWSNNTKFKRLYFYHARKAGGTSLSSYFSKVARHYGLEFVSDEFGEAEEPGTHPLPTFYVTHLREPIDRSISHFKYQGRWNCRDLSTWQNQRHKTTFRPTEDNANKIETWNSTSGHTSINCATYHGGKPYVHFKLGECAVNCYTQWFSGLSCPEYDVSITEQYNSAMSKLYRYNFIVVLEKLRDPNYVSAVEKFFDFAGISRKTAAFCENASHKANKLNPLVLRNDTIERLVDLNEIDVKLYKELTGCLPREGSNSYKFPKLDRSRFGNVTYSTKPKVTTITIG